MIDCICEIKGSHKIGHYLPGTRIPILSEEIVFQKKTKLFAFIIMAHIKRFN